MCFHWFNKKTVRYFVTTIVGWQCTKPLHEFVVHASILHKTKEIQNFNL